MIVLFASLVVVSIGIGAIALARTQVHQAADIRDEEAARALALDAADQSLLAISNHSTWRTLYKNQTIQSSFASGTFSWQLTDPNDGNLDNNTSDSVLLTATGWKGLSKYILVFLLVSDGSCGPLPAGARTLNFGTVLVDPSGNLNLNGGDLDSTQAVTNKGTISGNVQAPSVSGNGTVTGSVSNNPIGDNAPGQRVLNLYMARATSIPSGNMNNVVLAPGYNPYGQMNTDGVYFMDAGSTAVNIQNVRVNGTLIIRTTGGVTIGGPVLLEHSRADFPALIVIGDLTVNYNSGPNNLSESGHNFNPPGALITALATPLPLIHTPPSFAAWCTSRARPCSRRIRISMACS